MACSLARGALAAGALTLISLSQKHSPKFDYCLSAAPDLGRVGAPVARVLASRRIRVVLNVIIFALFLAAAFLLPSAKAGAGGPG
jgi:hypothetical protein